MRWLYGAEVVRMLAETVDGIWCGVVAGEYDNIPSMLADSTVGRKHNKAEAQLDGSTVKRKYGETGVR